ncbi:MAG: hypothetical protein ACJ77B_06360 [Chloroflexota bacterium]
MIQPIAARSRLVIALLGAVLLVGACSAAAQPATDPTPTPAVTPKITFPPRPTARPTATPAPTPTPQPTPAAGTGDLASGLKIGKPYSLVNNPANTALTGSFQFDVGGQHLEAAMDGREVWSSSSLVGAAIVMSFTGHPVTTAMFEGAARGGAATVDGKVSYATVLATRVAYITSSQTSAGLFVLHGRIVMVAGRTLPETNLLLASVIKANK